MHANSRKMMQMKYPDNGLDHYHAFIFDFDGTLVPCLDLRAMKQRVLDFTIERTGIARHEIQNMMMVEFIDHTHRWLIETGQQGTDYFEQAHNLVREIEIEAATATSLFPGTAELLSTLKACDKQIGIVTRNCEQALRLMCPNIDDFCDALVARDHAQYLKPDPRHLQQCLSALDTSFTDSLMIGDGVVDIQIAQAMKVDCVGVLGGHNSEAELAAASPTWLIKHVNDLKIYLGGHATAGF